MAKKLGIALAGGSARGFAHIGVLKVLEEEGIKPDMIGGCSMGSIIGGVYAAGCSLDELADMAEHFHKYKYIDFENPITGQGLLKGDKIEALIKEKTNGINIEDALIPFACLATWLEAGEGYYFTSGPMYKAIRASISIPHIFEPVTRQNRTLVDGGMYDRSAMSALDKLNPDVRIAVDVDYHGGPLPTPRGKKDILRSSYDVLSWMAVEHRYDAAQVVINPIIPIELGESYKDKDIVKIIKEGEDAARLMLKDIKAAIGQD